MLKCASWPFTTEFYNNRFSFCSFVLRFHSKRSMTGSQNGRYPKQQQMVHKPNIISVNTIIVSFCTNVVVAVRRSLASSDRFQMKNQLLVCTNSIVIPYSLHSRYLQIFFFFIIFCLFFYFSFCFIYPPNYT